MKKAANADIRNLFRKFGGDIGSYQEIQQDYAIDKAQKNWPIVAAMEKERVSAPTLKAANATRVGATTGAYAAVARPDASGRVAAEAGRANGAGVFSGAFARPAEEPVTQPVRSLFASPAAEPAGKLFANLGAPAKTAAPPAPSVSLNGAAKPLATGLFGSQPARSAEAGSIASIFSRLANPQSAAPVQDKSLRSMFGFLKK